MPTLTQQDVKKAREILARHDPRKLRSGSVNRLKLDEQSLSLLGTYGLQSLDPILASSGMLAKLQDNNMLLSFSIRLPDNPLGSYFNTQFALSKLNNRLVLRDLIIGNLAVPDWLAGHIPTVAEKSLSQSEIWQMGQAALVDYSFSSRELIIDYRWQSEWEQLARSKIRELTDHAAMNYYARIIYEMPYLQRMSFGTVMSNLFRQAQLRSDKHDAIEENRAILQLLGQWALGKQTYGDWYLPYFAVRIKGRIDLAQHLLVSAAIASQSNKDVSNLIGTGKEISDSDGGSGFDFSDLTADRSGSLLGKLATQDNASAIQVQKLLSDTQYSNNLLPDISRLPTPLNEQKFRKQFGNIRDKRYLELVTEIDNRIKILPFFKQMGL